MLEKTLWKRGLENPLLREILCWHICITGAALGLGVCLWPWTAGWFFWFGVAATLSAWNFYALIRFVPSVIQGGWSKSNLISLLINTNMRLLFTGILLYLCLTWFKASISALLSGLALLLVIITALGLKKALKKKV